MNNILSAVSFLDLPHEDIICHQIFCYLELKDLAIVQYTSKLLQSLVALCIAKHYKVIKYKHISELPNDLQEIIKNKNNIRVLSCKYNRDLTDEKVIPFVAKNEKLLHLDLS